jgi:hypothetical protein
LAQVMVRRLKRQLPLRWDGTPRFPQRVLQTLSVGYDDAEREAHRTLNAYALSRREAAGDAAGRVAADFVTTLLKKRLFSSPKAFAETVDTHLATMNSREQGSFGPNGAGGQAGRVRAAGTRVLRPLIDRLEESAEDDEAFTTAAREALGAAGQIAAPLSAEERGQLERLRTWARSSSERADGKFRAFVDWLDPIVRPGGLWSDERVIVFTEYRDTQRWLHERLIAAKVPAERIAQLHGGQDEKEREHVKNVFQESPTLPGGQVRILLATDAASEGINLQRYCHRLLHWEIPWNPNRLEQRNGRIDRHGQHAGQVEVYHFVPAGWQRAESDPGAFADGSLENELYFLHHAARKVEQIREDLGSAGEVIAAQVEQKMLGRRADWQTADAEITRRSGRAVLKVERDLARDLERLTRRLAESRSELNLSPATIERVVRTGLALAHRKDLTAVPAPDGVDAACFRLPELPGAWADARGDGLHHPVTGAERPVTFDRDQVAERSDIVLLHLGHRLVAMCLRLLRAEVWAGGGEAKLSRVTDRIVPGDTLHTPAVIAHGRVVITGAEGTRLHEEIVTAGGLIEGGKLARAKEADLEAWLSASTPTLPDPTFLSQLTERWPHLETAVSRALEVRADQRARSLHSLLETRCAEEVAGVETILADLERSIHAALADHAHWEQASLFEVDAEAHQLRADRTALTERLAAIPGMREQETAALRRRYADPTARWFPAAVTFLVPSTLARGAR